MRFYIITILLIQSVTLYSQSVKWYFPWENIKKELVEDNLEAIPLYLDGNAFRILKVIPPSGSTIKDIKLVSNNVSMDIYYLPLDKSGTFDVLLPFSANPAYSNETLFLVKFTGLEGGVSNVKISVNYSRSERVINRKVAVVAEQSRRNLHSNVWAYLGYNYLVKDLNANVIHDLDNHKINFMVIPGYALPNFDFNTDELKKIDNYLKSLGDRFDYYCIYLSGFQGKKSTILSADWKRKFPKWYSEVQKIFLKHNISTNQILLYPFDEPTGLNIIEASNFIKYLKKQKINSKTYITLHEAGSERLALEYDFVQVHIRKDDLLQKVLALGKAKEKLLIYETNVSSGNNNDPLKYLDLSLKSIKYNLGGYGMWNYADVKRSDLREFRNGKGSWEYTTSSKGDFYNSLIHRRNNNLYSSIRWEAFSAGQDEYFWFQRLIGKGKGSKKDLIVEGLLNRLIQYQEWEKMKLSLI